MTMTRLAVLSDDGIYRYRLVRRWDSTLPVLMFLMANPSKADAEIDDPTITRGVERSRRLGYGAMLVGNVDAYRTSSPNRLKAARALGIDVVGDQNRWQLEFMLREASAVVLAWGANPIQSDVDHAMEVVRYVGTAAYHLGLTKAGHPRHPRCVCSTPDTVGSGQAMTPNPKAALVALALLTHVRWPSTHPLSACHCYSGKVIR